MANLLHIARPYALAAFDYAREKQQLPAWKAFLDAAAFIARNPSVVRLLANPEVQPAHLLELFDEVLATQLNAEQKLLHLLAQNKRLMVLPEISESFNTYMATLEKISNVRVVTAIDIEDKFRTKLISVLSKRIQREVTLNCETDPAIIGGAVIHIGDHVIDGSIRGKLTRLLQNLTG